MTENPLSLVGEAPEAAVAGGGGVCMAIYCELERKASESPLHAQREAWHAVSSTSFLHSAYRTITVHSVPGAQIRGRRNVTCITQRRMYKKLSPTHRQVDHVFSKCITWVLCFRCRDTTGTAPLYTLLHIVSESEGLKRSILRPRSRKAVVQPC